MALQNSMRDIRSIAVVGAGTSGYLTVCYLCNKFPQIMVDWIYPKANNPIGVGEAVVPKVQQFLADIDISVSDILQHCNGGLKLGVEFDGFSKKGHRFFHPFGDDSKEQTLILESWHQNKVPVNVLQLEDIATHFDVGDLMSYMDTKMSAFDNLSVIRDEVTIADLDTYDIIVDSTGFERNIISDITDDNFISISDKIPNNAALVYRSNYSDKQAQQLPYTTCTAMESGWIWQVPLQHRVGLGYIHNDAYDVRDEFISFLQNRFKGVDESLIRSIPMKIGRNKAHLVDNVVCIGLSSCFIEPLESTGLYLIVTSIELLGKYINSEITSIEFNNAINDEFDTILNFILAHYKYTQNDNNYWNFYKDLQVDNFKENNIFPCTSWEYILDGMDQYTKNTERLPIREMLHLLKQSTYNEWLDNEKYLR